MTKTKSIICPRPRLDPDPDLVQRLVTRRLALRLGLTLPVAAAVASLAGLGPNSGRRG